jgi:hypothetical protein
MNGRAARAALVAFVLMALFAVVKLLGSGVPWLLLGGVTVAVLTVGGVWSLAQRMPDISAWARERLWAREAGSHHAFAGIALRIEDDGRHVWLEGRGLQRVLGRHERDEVLAARHSGHWRHDTQGRLMLRVDAVIDHLAHMPGRTDPRVQKLRRYLEREVLFPASERRRRA